MGRSACMHGQRAAIRVLCRSLTGPTSVSERLIKNMLISHIFTFPSSPFSLVLSFIQGHSGFSVKEEKHPEKESQAVSRSEVKRTKNGSIAPFPRAYLKRFVGTMVSTSTRQTSILSVLLLKLWE